MTFRAGQPWGLWFGDNKGKLYTPAGSESGGFKHGSLVASANLTVRPISQTATGYNVEIGVSKYGGAYSPDSHMDTTYRPEGNVNVSVTGDMTGGVVLTPDDFVDGKANISIGLTSRCDRVASGTITASGETDGGSHSYRPWMRNGSVILNASRSYYQGDIAGRYAEHDARGADPLIDISFTWVYKTNADIKAKYPGISLSRFGISHVLEDTDPSFATISALLAAPSCKCIACAVGGGIPYAYWATGGKGAMTRIIQSSASAPNWYGGHMIEDYSGYAAHFVDDAVVYLEYGGGCLPITWRPIGWIHNPNNHDHDDPSYTPANYWDWHEHDNWGQPGFDHDIEDYNVYNDYNNLHQYHGVFYMTP